MIKLRSSVLEPVLRECDVGSLQCRHIELLYLRSLCSTYTMPPVGADS